MTSNIFHRIFLAAIFCSLLSHTLLIGQSDAIEQLEKLEQFIPEMTSDTAMINAYNKLSYDYYMIDIDKTRLYSKKALEKAKAIDYKYGIAQALNYMAISHGVKGDALGAIKLNKQSLEIALEMNNPLLVSNCYNDLGISYHDINFPEKALEAYQESLRYSTLSNDDKLTCFTLNNIAIIYHELGEKKIAQEYYERIIETAQNSDHKMVQYYPSYITAERLMEEGKYAQAMESYNVAYEKAYGYYQKSEIYSAQAYLLQLQEKYDEAEAKILDAIALSNKMGDNEIAFSIFSHCDILIKNRKYKKAIAKINTLLSGKSDIPVNLLQRKELIELRIKANKAIGNNQAIADDFELFSQLQDSISSKERYRIMSEMEVKYKIEESERENQYLRKQKDQAELLLSEQKKNIYYLLGLILLGVLLAILLYKSLQNHKSFNTELKKQVDDQTKELKKSNQLLKSSNEELERFAFIASHDLKTPLRTIISFSGLIERELKSDEDKTVHEYLTIIKDAANRMNNLIVDVLEFSRLSYLEKEAETEVINTNNLLHEILNSLSDYIEGRNAKIINTNKLPSIRAHKSSITVLFQNLIENGIKYNDSAIPIIKVYATESPEFTSIFFEDNGIGIAEEYHDRIFIMFSRLHTHAEYEGSGLGLSICKKIINNLNGDILLHGEEGKGSTFELRLPHDIIVQQASDADNT